MVEEKFKGKDKEKSEVSEGIHIVEIIFGILILLYFLNLIGNFLSRHLGGVSPDGTSPTGFSAFSAIGQAIGRTFVNVFPSIQFIAIFLTLLFIMGIIYTSFRLHHIEKKYHLAQKIERNKQLNVYDEKIVNPKWQKVLGHVNGASPNDWRLAILEADILLGDMLEKMGYRGEGIGEMLKSIEENDFNTLNNAWEGHKIRNAIAHEGSDFILSQREAKRAISLYQSVFEEFHLI